MYKNHFAAWGLSAAVGLAWLGLPGEALAQAGGSSSAPTFAADVAPIMQVKCMECHNPNGIGPMALTTYEEVRPWAPMIRQKVSTREMPPWHVDKNFGIQEFKNDISLSDDEITTIVAWVDAGTPLGDPADLPPAFEVPDLGVWRLEEILGRGPDLVVRTTPFTVPAFGPDQWWQPVVPIEGPALNGPRYIMANETRPSPVGRRATHHANTSIVRDESSQLAGDDEGNGFSNFGIGKPFDIYPPNTGMRVLPGDRLSFNIHYYPIGEEIKDEVAEVGVWFWPEGEVPMIETAGDESFTAYRDDVEMLIPPGGRQMTQGITVLQTAARIHSFRVHQHLIGTGQSMEAVYPDGRVEILGKAGWHPNWHITYLYEDHVAPLLPKGTVIIISAWYDNTANNPWNPDASVWRVHGRRTGDEMSHMWVGISYLDDEEYEYLVAERERVLAEMGITSETASR